MNEKELRILEEWNKELIEYWWIIKKKNDGVWNWKVVNTIMKGFLKEKGIKFENSV